MLITKRKKEKIKNKKFVGEIVWLFLTTRSMALYFDLFLILTTKKAKRIKIHANNDYVEKRKKEKKKLPFKMIIFAGYTHFDCL
jgi:hypothetical protein